jgi:hypothetical protein
MTADNLSANLSRNGGLRRALNNGLTASAGDQSDLLFRPSRIQSRRHAARSSSVLGIIPAGASQPGTPETPIARATIADIRVWLEQQLRASEHESFFRQFAATGVAGAEAREEQPAAPRSAMRVAGPAKAVLAIFDRWHIDDQVGASILGEDDPSFVALLRVGRAVLRSRDARDRAGLFIRLYEGVYSLFANSETERRWLHQEQPRLDGRSVHSLLAEGSFLNLARAQAFVDLVNGR